METRGSLSLETLHRLAQHAGIKKYQELSKSVLYERLQDLGQGLERIRRYEERSSGSPLPPSSLYATSSSSRLDFSSARSLEVTGSAQNRPRKRRLRAGEFECESLSAGSSSYVDNGVHYQSTSSSSSSSSSSSASSSYPSSGSRALKKSKSSVGYSYGSSSNSSGGSRGSYELKSVSNGAKRRPSHTPVNKVDPIMFVPLKKTGVWKYSRPHGGVVAFNSDTLADFMLASGDFHDPETRIPFTEEHLSEIDAICAKSLKKGGTRRPSLVDARRNPQIYAAAKERRDALESLERCAGDVIADILKVIETADPDDAQLRLVLHELPVFADLYHQLREADSAYAHQCLDHWRAFIAGPPNHPNEDAYGLVDCVKHYLQMLHENSPPPVAAGLAVVPGHATGGEGQEGPESD